MLFIEVNCSFSQPSYTVTEGGTVNVTILTSSAGFSFPFTVNLRYMDGSAEQIVDYIHICTAPGDYTSGEYSLSFSAGQTSAILSVQTSDNTIAELEEFFKVMITGSNRQDKVLIGDPDICFVTIQDDDGGFVLK